MYIPSDIIIEFLKYLSKKDAATYIDTFLDDTYKAIIDKSYYASYINQVRDSCNELNRCVNEPSDPEYSEGGFAIVERNWTNFAYAHLVNSFPYHLASMAIIVDHSKAATLLITDKKELMKGLEESNNIKAKSFIIIKQYEGLGWYRCIAVYCPENTITVDGAHFDDNMDVLDKRYYIVNLGGSNGYDAEYNEIEFINNVPHDSQLIDLMTAIKELRSTNDFC